MITNLSKNVMEEMHKNMPKRTKAIVQYLSYQEILKNGKTLFQVQISDGFFSMAFVLYPEIVSNFVSQVKEKDILEVGIAKKEVKSLNVLFEFKVIYSSLTAFIGKPIDYAINRTNLNGCNIIPENVIALNTRLTNNSFGETSTSTRLNDNPSKYAQLMLESDHEEDNRDHFTLISNLSPYDRSFKIRGRVMKQSILKPFKTKDNKDGAVFIIVIYDNSLDIQGTFFNEMAIRFSTLLEEGKIYSFSDAEIKSSNKYNTTSNKYELHFTDRSEIKKLPEDKTIPMSFFKFVLFNKIEEKSEGDLIDVIAIVHEPGSIKETHLKNGEAKEKKTMQLKDDTGYLIDVTLWGDLANNTELQKNSIVILQDVRVKNYNGKTLTFMANSKIITRVPDHPRVRELSVYKNSNSSSMENTKSLADISHIPSLKFGKIAQLQKECSILSDDQENTKLYFTIVGHLVRIFSSLYYDSCQNDTCMKKLSKNTTYDRFDCEKCHQTFDKPRIRFMTSLKFSDDTGSIFVMASGDEICQTIFKRTPENLKQMKENDEKYFSEYLKDCLFEEYRVRLIAKKDSYSNDPKIRYQLIKINSVTNNPEMYVSSFGSLLNLHAN